MQFFTGDVAAHPEEHVEDRLALLGVLEVVVLEIAGESLLLEIVGHGITLREAPRPSNTPSVH